MWERLAYYRNDLPPGNHWIGLRLVGTRSNRDAIGARVWVSAGGKKRLKERVGGGTFESSNDPRLHVGLGSNSRLDGIEIRWPSGTIQKVPGAQADQFLTIVEPADGGSPH
jgi:hypothetical protein